MGWRDLIQFEEQEITAPWLGGRSLRYLHRWFVVEGRLPPQPGWYRFRAWHKEAKLVGPGEPQLDGFEKTLSGYLIGNKVVLDDVSASSAAQITELRQLSRILRQVHLIEEGLDRFTRIEAGSYGGTSDEVPLIYKGQAFPLGPEEDVLSAFLDRKDSVSGIKGVTPALEVAFRMETLQRAEVDRRRAEAERLRREEEERRAIEERRREIAETLGDGAGRRRVAAIDFEEAAKAALAVGGAELLDVRNGRGGERVIRYRMDSRRFECVCDSQMRIIDAGVCLTDESTGEKGDTFFTLESLPAVIRQADREGVLVIFRHV